MSDDGVKNYKSILTLIVFLIANILVILPTRIPIPIPKQLRRGDRARTSVRVPLDFSTAPLAGVLILLAARAIDGGVVRNGIVGADGIKPINIMSLFISLAYISISLDVTGLLRFLALWVVQKGGSSGRRLYLFLYLFFFTAGVIVGNDPIILSGTAFLTYMTRVAGIVPPTAWIFAQFAACNMSSAILVSSNPTNLVLAGAFGLSFIKYTLNLLLPVFASALTVFPLLLFWLFNDATLIPRHIVPLQSTSNADALVDKHGAIFGSLLLLSTLVVLLATSAAGLNVEVWEITVPAAVIMFGRDILHDINSLRKRRKESRSAKEDTPPALEEDPAAIELQVSSADMTPASASTLPPPTPTPSKLTLLKAALPTPLAVLNALPLPLLPFAFSMFILVQGLASTGWLNVFAAWWTTWVDRTGPVGAVGGMGFVSVCLCNFAGTNIGATILLARILQLWISSSTPSTRAIHGSMYALALGSNYGAFSSSFSASLAGLLWRQILRRKGIEVRAGDFVKLNVPIVGVAMAVGCTVLLGQVYVVT